MCLGLTFRWYLLNLLSKMKTLLSHTNSRSLTFTFTIPFHQSSSVVALIVFVGSIIDAYIPRWNKHVHNPNEPLWLLYSHSYRSLCEEGSHFLVLFCLMSVSSFRTVKCTRKSNRLWTPVPTWFKHSEILFKITHYYIKDTLSLKFQLPFCLVDYPISSVTYLPLYNWFSWHTCSE